MIVLLFLLQPLWAAPQAAWDAALMEFRQGYYPQANKIKSHLRAACKQGYEPTCQWLKQRKTVKAHDFFRKHCQAGDSWSCVALGWHLQQSPLVGTSTQKSLAYFEQACLNKEKYGCLAAIKLQLNTGGQNPQFTAKLQALCKKKFYPACRELGISKLRSNPKSAIEQLKTACRNKDIKACAHLGGIHLQQKNPSLATPLLKNSCVEGASVGCYWLGRYHAGSNKSKSYYERACDGSSSQACLELAQYYKKNKRPKQALSYYQKSCTIGHPTGCFTAGYQLERKKRYKQALTLYQHGCLLGNGPACVNGGMLTKIQKTAQQLFTQGCELGDKRACTLLSNQLLTGPNKNIPTAVDILDISCKSGDKKGCALLYGKAKEASILNCEKGIMESCYDAARLLKDQPQQAFQSAQKGCQAKHGAACTQLGFFYIQGKGVEKNDAKAHELFQQSCAQKVAAGCFNLGLMHLEGRAIDKDLTLAQGHFSKSCNLGDARGCSYLGLLLRKQGKTSEAKAALEKGCNRGDADNCAQYAFLLLQETPQQLRQAGALFAMSCSKGHSKACLNYAVMLHKGSGMQQDLVKSQKMMHRACQLGDQQACKQKQGKVPK